jgi:hypothetical protein
MVFLCLNITSGQYVGIKHNHPVQGKPARVLCIIQVKVSEVAVQECQCVGPWV